MRLFLQKILFVLLFVCSYSLIYGLSISYVCLSIKTNKILNGDSIIKNQIAQPNDELVFEQENDILDFYIEHSEKTLIVYEKKLEHLLEVIFCVTLIANCLISEIVNKIVLHQSDTIKLDFIILDQNLVRPPPIICSNYTINN